jgi:hypothetical protein
MFAMYPRIDKPAIEVTVPGMPPLFAANRAKEKFWRQQMIDAVRAASDTPTGDIAIELEFTIEPAKMQLADLDNFIVPAATAAAAALFEKPRSSPKITTLVAVKQPANHPNNVGTTLRAWPELAFDLSEHFVWRDGDITITSPDQPNTSDYSTSETRGELVTKFIDDDEGFISWRDSHPNGYILNTTRTPTPSYLVLHRTSCYTMNKLRPGYEHWAYQYIKICADRAEDLAAWARVNVSSTAQLRACKICKPTTK